MSALILMMLKDETDALEEEIADIFKLLNLPEYRHIAVCPQNRARLKALLSDLLVKLAEQKQKRLKRYMKRWGRKKNISREKMKKITDFILSAEFMMFYIDEGCLDFVLYSAGMRPSVHLSKKAQYVHHLSFKKDTNVSTPHYTRSLKL